MANQLALEADRPGIGHNQAPLDEQIDERLAPFRTRQVELLELAGQSIIIDQVSAEKVTLLAGAMRAYEKEVDEARDEMMRPYLEATRTINAAFNALPRPVALARAGADGRGGLMLMLTRYKAKVEEEAQAERDRLAAEQRAREAEAEAARRAVEQKRATGTGSVAAELEVLQAEDAAARLGRQAEAIRPEPIRTNLGSLGTRRDIKFEITDLRKLLGWLLRGNLKGQVQHAASTILGVHLRSLGVATVAQGVEIPGVAVRVESSGQVR